MSLGYSRDRPGHCDTKLIIHGYLDVAAGHVDGDLGITESKFSRYGGRCTTAAARSQSISRTALPYLDLDVLTV